MRRTVYVLRNKQETRLHSTRGTARLRRKVSQLFKNDPQERWLRGQRKKDGEIFYQQILINAKLQTGNRGQKPSWIGEVHWGGEGPHWTVVPFKNKKEKEEEEEEEEKEEEKKKEKNETEMPKKYYWDNYDHH